MWKCTNRNGGSGWQVMVLEGKEEYLSSPGDCGGREEAVPPKKGIAHFQDHMKLAPWIINHG